jgi:hypothetical protein
MARTDRLSLTLIFNSVVTTARRPALTCIQTSGFYELPHTILQRLTQLSQRHAWLGNLLDEPPNLQQSQSQPAQSWALQTQQKHSIYTLTTCAESSGSNSSQEKSKQTQGSSPS